MEADRERWDDRYRAMEPPPDHLEPMPPEGLVLLLDLVPTSGRAVDLACGLGRQAVWAAQRGLQVVALDVSAVAVDYTRRLARQCDVVERMQAHTLDLDELAETGSVVDREAAEALSGDFDLVICQRFRDPRLYPKILDLLAPGGLAVVSVLSEVGLDTAPGPHRAPAGELSRAVSDWSRSQRSGEILADREADGLATIVVRRRPW